MARQWLRTPAETSPFFAVEMLRRRAGMGWVGGVPAVRQGVG
jgi:hypothetical protein